MTAVSVDRWVRAVRRRERWQRALRFAAPWFGALALAWGSGALLLGASGDTSGWLGAICIAAASLLVAVAAWPRRTPWQRIDAELGLDGRLETFVEPCGVAHGPMRSWLERDLAASIPAAGAGHRLRRLGRLPVRPLRSLLVLLAILYLLGLVLPPMPDGVLPLGAGAAGGGAGGPGANESQSPSSAVPPSQPPPEPEMPPVPPEPEPEPPPVTLPPESLIDGGATRDAVVVPTFVGDGEGERTQATVVDVEGASESGGSAAPAASRAAVPGGGADGARPEDPAFERAAERAQRSRHVPAGERAFVNRWFRIERGGDR